MDLVGAAVAVFDRFALWAEQKIIAGLDSAYGGHPMYVVDGIPYRNRTVGRQFAPFFADRLRAFFADPRIRGNVWVYSGSRLKSYQRVLFTGWLRKLAGWLGYERYNLAADPDRTIGTCRWADPPFVARGSWHMVQDSVDPRFAGAGAVDLSTNLAWGFVHSVAAEYGIRFPIWEQSRKEPWHGQAYTTAGIYPTAQPEPPTVIARGNGMYLVVHENDQHYVVNRHGDKKAIGDTLAFAMRDNPHPHYLDDTIVGGGDDVPEHVMAHILA